MAIDALHSVAPTGFRWRLHARDSQRQGGVCEPSRNAVKGDAAGLCRHLKYRRHYRPLFRDGRSCGLGACMVCLRSAGWLLHRGDSWPKSRLLRSAPFIRREAADIFPGKKRIERGFRTDSSVPAASQTLSGRENGPSQGVEGRLHPVADWVSSEEAALSQKFPCRGIAKPTVTGP
jgi:hypothetical protein